MRSMNVFRGLTVAGALTLSSLATAQVRISEIHYDNAGADAGEAIEVSAPPAPTSPAGRSFSTTAPTAPSYDTGAAARAGPRDLRRARRRRPELPRQRHPERHRPTRWRSSTARHRRRISFLRRCLRGDQRSGGGLTSTDIGASQNGTAAGRPLAAARCRGSLDPEHEHVRRLQRRRCGAAAAGSRQRHGRRPPPRRSRALQRLAGRDALDASSTPINGVPFSWTSSNPTVATVSGTGVVTRWPRATRSSARPPPTASR